MLILESFTSYRYSRLARHHLGKKLLRRSRRRSADSMIGMERVVIMFMISMSFYRHQLEFSGRLAIV